MDTEIEEDEGMSMDRKKLVTLNEISRHKRTRMCNSMVSQGWGTRMGNMILLKNIAGNMMRSCFDYIMTLL